MNIKQAKEQIKNAVQAYLARDEFGQYLIPVERQRPVFLIGAPGIGKTAIMEQISRELGIGLVSYSMTHHTRQSALGLPFIAQREFEGQSFSVSEYTMSEIIASVYKCMTDTGCREGILFLDEINCVSETLAPAMLQFLQYKIFGMHQVPAGWVVVTAGNPPEYNKSVREFDVVTWDRLKRIEVEPDYEAWKDYARQRRIHGSVLSFLDLKQSFFYVMETRVDRKSFVTARGWEDLSEMIRLYEKQGLTVDQHLTEQYLQNPTVAREFALYYDLYNKYKSDYELEQILGGTAGPELSRRASQARFDERLSLLGLLVDSMAEELERLMEREEAVLENRRILKAVKEELTGEDWESLLERHAGSLRRELAQGEKARSLEKERVYALRYVLRFLEENTQRLRREGCRGGEAAFALLKGAYEEEVARHKTVLAEGQSRLRNLFAFVEQAFGQEQEMLLLVTELTVRRPCAAFIAKFGCEEYFRHNRELMFYERKKELLERIEKLEES